MTVKNTFAIVITLFCDRSYIKATDNAYSLHIQRYFICPYLYTPLSSLPFVRTTVGKVQIKIKNMEGKNMFNKKNFLRIVVAACAIFTSIIGAITGAIDKPAASPDGATLISDKNIVLTDAITKAQGLTTDGKYFYFSGKTTLTKMSLDCKTPVKQKVAAIPTELFSKYGSNHIGGLSYYDGKIYVALEDNQFYKHPLIAVYDAETLEYTGEFVEISNQSHMAWCAANPADGYIYTSDWSNATQLNVYSLKDLSYVKTIDISAPIDRVQGAEFYNGVLYLSSDVKNDSKPILAIDVSSGTVSTAFNTNIGKGFEAEDVTILPMADGSLFHVISAGKARVNIHFSHYSVDDLDS